MPKFNKNQTNDIMEMSGLSIYFKKISEIYDIRLKRFMRNVASQAGFDLTKGSMTYDLNKMSYEFKENKPEEAVEKPVDKPEPSPSA